MHQVWVFSLAKELSHHILMTESGIERFGGDEKDVLLPMWFYLSLKHGHKANGFEPISHVKSM